MSLENLELDVGVKLAFVEKSLTEVETCRKRLQENADKVKEEIQRVVEQQVGSLRVRERQLVRQVEVVTAHQTCLLSTQQAGLLHSQGALTATRNILQQCSSNDHDTLAKIKVDNIESIRHVQPLNVPSVELNDTVLSNAISGFGRVKLPATITHHPSPVIPAKAEDYGDVDHHVLHKSVAVAASGSVDAPLNITVQFPRLSNNSWLIQEKKMAQQEQSPKQIFGGSGAPTGSGDIASWLGNLRMDSAHEDYDSDSTPQSLGSFDMVSNSSARSVHTSESSSIEIVPSHFNSEKDDCSTPGSALCEIENLHNCITDKSCWLTSDRTPTNNSMLQQLRISSACRANETCSSFSDCLCEKNCGETALEKAQQSIAYRARKQQKRSISEEEGSNEVISHMAKILASENSQWLVKRRQNNSWFSTHLKPLGYDISKEKWLQGSGSSPVNIQAPKITLATHSNVWLLHKLKAEKDKEKQEKDIEKQLDEKESTIPEESLIKSLKDLSFSSNGLPGDTNLPDKELFYTSLKNNDPSMHFRPWLLPTKFDCNRENMDRKLEENDISSKKRWLARARNVSQLSQIDMNPHQLPEPILALARASVSDWLMKNL